MNFLKYKKELAFFAKNCTSTLSTFDDFLQNIHDPVLKNSISEATLFAAKAHFGQTRNQNPNIAYIVHPLRVSHLLWKEGDISNPHILIAALLHDVLEDTSVSKQEILNHFGITIVSLVEELTDKHKLTAEEEAYKASFMSIDAKIIKLADRAHNLKDLIDHPPQIWDVEKVKNFVDRSKILFEKLKGSHPTLEKCYVDSIHALSFI